MLIPNKHQFHFNLRIWRNISKISLRHGHLVLIIKGVYYEDILAAFKINIKDVWFHIILSAYNRNIGSQEELTLNVC